MKNYFNNIPMPIVGVMLACATLGNVLQSYGDIYRNIMGVIAGVIFVLITVKIVSCFHSVKKELENPVVASVFSTYTMGIILLATYVKSYHGGIAYAMWLVGIVLHVAWMIVFSVKYLRHFDIKKVFPSWFIVYVGIAIVAVTGKAFNPTLGQIAFWFALIAYIILIFIVGKRVLKVKQISEPALPTLVIFAAPGSLCLAGYINSFETYHFSLFIGLLIISQFFYIGSVIQLIKLLKLKFYPSYSAFTFPLVISALALKLSNSLLIRGGMNTPGLDLVIMIEEIIAVLIVFYVLMRYITHIGTQKVN